jgi:tRNA nucleotidyltransferase (CCA-adding enzyme)
MKDLLQQRLDPPVFALLRRVGELAAEEGVGVFLVGGPVRDLLRGAKVLDLDVAVEGDGIVFARALAQRLGGEVKGHLRFGTAVLVLRPEWGPPGTPTAAFAAPVKLDVASARRESYRRPGALPTVAPGTSYDDLYRRDFTVNAMAVRLDPPAFGELLDPFGGRRDLAARLLRVLHEGSFRDDPTRLFRAVRFEQRLGFALEPGTGRLLGEAVAARALDTVTGERIRNELFLLLSEKNPLPGLRRLRQLSLFRAVHPGFAVEEAAIARVGALGERLGTDRRGRLARLLALFSDLDLGAARAVAARLALSGPPLPGRSRGGAGADASPACLRRTARGERPAAAALAARAGFARGAGGARGLRRGHGAHPRVP